MLWIIFWVYSRAKESLRSAKNVVFSLFCIFVGRPMWVGYIAPPLPLPLAILLGMRDWSRSIDCSVNLNLIQHCTVEFKIQGMFPTQWITWACLALSWSTTKFQKTKVVFQTQKYTNMWCTHKWFSILSKMCFLVFFSVAGKPSMHGKCAFHICNIFPFDALYCTVYVVRSSINKPHLFDKYFILPVNFRLLTFGKANGKFERTLVMLLKQSCIEQ